MGSARWINRFRRTEDGAILILVAVSLAVLLGMAALAFDFGRVSVTQSELQSYADNVALAAAGELDGRLDSITRATNAAANMITDSQTFGVRNKDQLLSGASDYQLFFYAAPTNPDSEPAQAADLLDPNDAASALRAAFVRVVVATHEVDTPLAAAMAGLIDDPYRFASVRAEAVAGFTMIACDITPLFFCLPQPSLSVSPGQMIKMVSQGGGSQQWGPGNFGFLAAGATYGFDTAGACQPAPNGQKDSCALAASRAVGQCFKQNGVETKPGLSVGNMISGFNTRFDQYDAAAKQYQNSAKYVVDNFAGAPNVLDGWITKKQGNNCNVTKSPPYNNNGVIDPTATVGLPLDNCFATNSCPQGRIGNGIFDIGLQDYLKINYGANFATNPPTNVPAWFPLNGTRYQIYQAEVANQASLNSILTNGGKLESNLPNCQPPGVPDPYRRVIYAAGIDCASYQSQLNGGSGVIPVNKFVEIFLVRPAESDGTGANAVIYGEVVKTVLNGNGNNGNGGILHDLIQLYR